jgi:hypothetical protein
MSLECAIGRFGQSKLSLGNHGRPPFLRQIGAQKNRSLGQPVVRAD